jgi:uncharacterized damage-inducible protein DinB
VSKPDLAAISNKLARAQEDFLRAADFTPPDLWRTRPPNGGWSAAEIVAHLCQVERGVIGAADRIIRHPPRPVPFLKRFHFPLEMVEARVIRRQSPIPLDPDLLSTKESMLASLRALRERTLAFLEETSSRDLSAYYWPHPFLGMLNAYAWLCMIASHQIRHTKQMRQLSAGLPKHVVTSQK